MSSYNDALDQAANNAFCDLARTGVASGLLFTAFTATTIAGAIGGLAVSGISAHLYATYCGRPPAPPPYGEPQDWEGGQCVDVPYRIDITFALFLSPKGANVPVGRVGGTFHAIGPVTLAEAYDTGDQDNDIRVRASWKGGSGDDSVVKGVNNDPDNPQWGYNDVQIVVTREDGAPDICGNPPPIPPPDHFDAPGDITYINREGDTINAPVTFDFRSPRIGINGDVSIPVNLRFDLDPTLNIGGTININTGHFTINIGDPRAPVGKGDEPGNVYIPPGTPPGTPPGVPDDPPPEPPPDDDTEPLQVIRGVIVSVSEADTTATIIFQDQTPDIYAPSLGSVSFLCRVNNQFAWTADIPVKNRKQIIECPWKFGAYDVKATPKPGANFALSVVYDLASL